MTTLIMVRHGLSTGNLEGVYCGQLDYPLAEKGFAQAALTGKYLKKNYHIDHIYSSDLLRAMQTAEPTARAFGLEIIPESDLREIGVGEWQGQNAEMIIQTKVEEPIGVMRPRGAKALVGSRSASIIFCAAHWMRIEIKPLPCLVIAVLWDSSWHIAFRIRKNAWLLRRGWIFTIRRSPYCVLRDGSLWIFLH